MYTTTSLTFSALALTTFLSFSIANPVELRPNPVQPRAAASTHVGGLTCSNSKSDIPGPWSSWTEYCGAHNPTGATTCDNNVVVAIDSRCRYPMCKCGNGMNSNPPVVDGPPPVANAPPPVPDAPPANPPNADAQAPTPDCGALTLGHYGDENPGLLVDGGPNETVLNVRCVSVSPIIPSLLGPASDGS